MDDENLSDEEFETTNTINVIEDLNKFYEDYEELKKTYITKPTLNKYEKTKIISERAQQIADGGISFLKNPDVYNSVLEIATQELMQKKIPFILRRPIPNGYEYWKLEDCAL